MGYEEKISALAKRLPELIDHLQTEESTKNALVMPFLAALGYDIFNPQEVVPEFVADVGTKKGEKVDYAILADGNPVILIECKKADQDLSQADMSQLYRYFSVTKARIGILTNGVSYRFFSDLEEANKMDERPFLELSLEDLRPSALSEIRRLTKESFDLDHMLGRAEALKYTSEMLRVLADQAADPDEELVRFFFARVRPGMRFTAAMKETFTPLVAAAFQEYVKEKVNARLRSALQSEAAAEQRSELPTQEVEKNGIVTTEEELEGYRVVKAIVCRLVAPDRVTYRDQRTYMSVLLDDNNRKTICRLWFNAKRKYLGVLDAEKNETRAHVESASDIYQHADRLIEVVERYESSQ
jgi:hypothetical protein